MFIFIKLSPYLLSLLMFVLFKIHSGWSKLLLRYLYVLDRFLSWINDNKCVSKCNLLPVQWQCTYLTDFSMEKPFVKENMCFTEVKFIRLTDDMIKLNPLNER